jgi:alkylation response protein AidB-like acyl-CoA dehydrogenase
MGNNCRAYRRSFVEACLASAPSKAAGWLDTLEEVLRSVVVRHAIEVDRQCSYPYQSVHALRQIGLFGVNVPVEAGGLGFGDSVATLAVESIASACASTAAIVLFHLQVSRRLVQFGNAIQIDEDLPLLASGQWLASSAWTEAGSGADKAQSGTIVDGSEHGRRITGEKTFCTGLEGASLIHVLAGVRRADGTVAPTFIRVRTDVPGVDTGDIYDLVGLRGSSTGTIRLKGVEVDDNDIVGGIGDGMKLMQANHTVLLNPGLLGLGVARTAYEETKRLSRGLSAAMRDITGYQHTRFVLADMELAVVQEEDNDGKVEV